MRKKMIFLLCALLLLIGCSSQNEWDYVENNNTEEWQTRYEKAYINGYNQAVADIGENIHEYLDIISDDANHFSESWGLDDTQWVIYPYLYGEEYGEYNEEDLYCVIEALMRYYEYYEDGNCKSSKLFYEWHDGRFEIEVTH